MTARWTILCAIVATAAPAAAGPLGLDARHDAVLGTDASVTISVASALAGELEWIASAGEITGDRSGAELLLPVTGAPQIVIAAALDPEGAIVDWLAIPVAAQARVRVETARGADVIVEVAGREFGPVRADRSGIALVDIVVPPGVDLATTRATDRYGSTRVETMPLGTAPAARVLTTCAPDGRVTIIAVTATGEPSEQDPLVTSSRGVVGALAGVGPGVHTAAPALSELDAGEVVVTARVGDLESACRFEHVVPVLPVVQEVPRPPPQVIVDVVPKLARTRAPARTRVTLRAGWIDNLGQISAPTVALDASVALLDGRLDVGIELAGYHATAAAPTEGAAPVDLVVTATALLARLSYRIAIGPGEAWAGAGAGALFADTTLDSAETGMQRAQVVRPAGSMFVGGSLRAGPGAIVAEAAYWHARSETGDVRGRLGGLVATLGFGLAY